MGGPLTHDRGDPGQVAVDQCHVGDRAQHLRAEAGEGPQTGPGTGPEDDRCQTGAMETRRWTNPSQPQTLQIAVFLLYINAFFALIGGGLLSPISLLLVAGGVAAGFGIANERKWGYGLGLLMAFLPFVETIIHGNGFVGTDLVTLAFEIALVALLLHPQSRDYQRIWFS